MVSEIRLKRKKGMGPTKRQACKDTIKSYEDTKHDEERGRITVRSHCSWVLEAGRMPGCQRG